MNTQDIDGLSIREVYDLFLISKQSSGVSPKTIQTYRSHFRCISHYINIGEKLCFVSDFDIEKMIIKMQEKELSNNTIASYLRTLRSFSSWCKSRDLLCPKIPSYRAEETVKDTYTDEDIRRLLIKPNLKECTFAEYRCWVIVNLLLNCGCRAATIRGILNKDVDLKQRLITYRHTKNKKVQIIPLCSEMVVIFTEYMKIRGGKADDYLFCTEDGEQLSEDVLRRSIARYNNSRGVQKTATHLFRHTFARLYLVNCHGDPFTLQKILGHSTLDMTKHYCQIYNTDLMENFDEKSPLSLYSKRKKITIR